MQSVFVSQSAGRFIRLQDRREISFHVFPPKRQAPVAASAARHGILSLTPLPSASFHTTRWTRVRAAKADSDGGRRALADLCDAYYEPVVAYLCSVFRDADAAREMSHAFFAEMLGGGRMESAGQDLGRFRSYLLVEQNSQVEG